MKSIRMLGRQVEHLGKTYPLSIIEAVEHSDGLWYVSVVPFCREVHSTPYHSGTIRVCNPADHTLPYYPAPEPPHRDLH